MSTWQFRTVIGVALAALVGGGLVTGQATGQAAAVGGAEPASRAAPHGGVHINRLLGVQTLPFKDDYEGTVVGGFSGLDRDSRTDTWYLISDDRWRYNPARFYTAKLDIDRLTGEFSGARLTGVKTLTRADGTPYPGFGLPESADPETIRFDRRSGRLLWAHEGDRPDEQRPTLPISPLWVRWIDTDGKHLGELEIPDNLELTDHDSGVRRNQGFEGLTFTPTGIAAMVEGPRFEDGPTPSVDHGAPARLTTWNRRGKIQAQYAYPIDKTVAAPIPPTGITDSGVSEILAVGSHRFLAVERTWIQGVTENYDVKLYEFSTLGATNVLKRDSLADGTPYRPVRKRLVLDLSSAQPKVENIEGLAYGPRLATGECTIVLGSDDNFDNREQTQFLVFAASGC